MSATTTAKRLARKLLPEGVAQTLRHVRYQAQTIRLKGLNFRLELPNRRVLEDEILLALANDHKVKRVLFVGCRWYTKIYSDSFPAQAYWTIEIDPDQAKFGSKSNHITDSYLNLSQHVSADTFDAIVINGVFGWGIDAPAETELALAETMRALTPGGIVVIGYNNTPDNHPSFIDVPSPLLATFVPDELGGLGQRFVTPNDPGNHTFEFYRKPGAAA
jgi:SAM-dependent methyltransferase